MIHFTDNFYVNVTANFSVFFVCYWIGVVVLNIVVDQISMRRKL